MSAALRLDRRSAPMTLLFSRYVTGHIAESAWSRFAEAFDAAEATAEERAAFVRFFYDATSEEGDPAIPTVEDMKDMLAMLRAA